VSDLRQGLTAAQHEALDTLASGNPQWRRMTTEALAAEIELATIMPGNTRSDYVRAAAMCLHLAERLGQ
jgi:hypothetical protein